MDRLLLLLVSLAATPLPAKTERPSPPARHSTLPAVSPNGRQVVFCSEHEGGSPELYVADMATGLSRRLTYSEDQKGPQGWTGDGTRIVYSVTHGDTAELRTVAPDGSGARRLLSREAKGITLSNDGRRVAYTVGTWTRNRIWVADVDGAHPRALTDSSSGYFNLAWSPDDRMLAVTHRDSTGALQIWLVNPEPAMKPRELVRLPEEEGRPQWPAWSPDGRTIAFQIGVYVREDPSKSDAHVCVVDVASGAVKRLRVHPKPLLDETPSWQGPDHIAFQSTQTGAFEVWVMRTDGSGARRVTR